MNDTIERWWQAVQSNPRDAVAHYNLGFYLAIAHCYTESVEHLEMARDLMLPDPRVYNTLGYSLNKQGRNSEAIECFRLALSLDPYFIPARDNLLYYLHYEYDCSPEEMLHEHRMWDKYHASDIRNTYKHLNYADPDKVLKVGYVSADFRSHSVARFLEPVLSNHNTSHIEVHCYADIERSDHVSNRLASYTTNWQVVKDLTDNELAQKIYTDKIDILVDLAGHTANNRLCVFARRPAPLQITWLGYPDTTGLADIKYRITDAWADPPGQTDDWHSEDLLRLPNGFLCFQRPENSAQISPLPMQTNKTITFGSFNALPKVTPQVVAAWASILAAIPDSRLIMKNKSFIDAGTQQRYRSQFKEHGIDTSRIDMLGWLAGHSEHMALYERIDIALDTFPYNGTTTSCESLWMGVPVLTLKGITHVGRVGTSLLSQIGLHNWIAENQDQYIEKAIEYAKIPQLLASIRMGLRERMLESTLCDGLGFAKKIEDAYRSVWAMWCANKHHL